MTILERRPDGRGFQPRDPEGRYDDKPGNDGRIQVRGQEGVVDVSTDLEGPKVEVVGDGGRKVLG